MTGIFNVMLLALIGGLFTSNLVNAYGKNNGAGFGEPGPDTFYIEIYLKPNVATPIWSIKLYSNSVLVPSTLDPLTGAQACITTTAGHGVNEVNDGNDDTYGSFTATNCGSGANRLRIQALNAKNLDTVVVSSRSEIFGASQSGVVQTVVKYRNWCDPFSNNRCKWKNTKQTAAAIPLVPMSAGDKEKFTCPLSVVDAPCRALTQQPTQAPTQSPTILTTYAVDIYLKGDLNGDYWGVDGIYFVKMFNNGVQIPMSQLSISYPACINTNIADVSTAYRAIDTDDNSYGSFGVWNCPPADRKITVSSGSNAPFDVVTVSGSGYLRGQRVEMYKTAGGVKTSLYDTIVPTIGSIRDVQTLYTFTKP